MHKLIEQSNTQSKFSTVLTNSSEVGVWVIQSKKATLEICLKEAICDPASLLKHLRYGSWAVLEPNVFFFPQ